MKTFRLFAALLVVALFTAPAFSQESSEITSLLTKARKGNGIAQYNLGLAYAEGKGVTADPVEAYVWLTLARENGARGRALDTLMSSLDKSSLDLAQRRLTERKAELGVRTPSTVNVLTTTTPAPKAAVPAAATPAPAQAPADESLAKVQAERDALRAERERLIGVSSENEKAARTATAANQALQDQARAAEAKATELTRTTDIAKGELARAKLALTAAQKTTKPVAADPIALDAKNKELQAALAELESAKAFGRQVEDSLDKVNDDRTRVAATAAAELEAARAFGSQVEATLNRVTDEKAALTAQLAQANASLGARSAAPAYPNLSGRVTELETAYTTASTSLAQASAEADRAKLEVAKLTKAKDEAQAALTAQTAVAARAQLEVAALTKASTAKPATPAYPDLSGRVSELEAALAAAKTAPPAYPDLRDRVKQMEAAEVTLRQGTAATGQNMERQLRAANEALAAKSAEAASAQQEVAALTKANAAKPIAPAYPDLRTNVAELEAKVAALTAASTRAQQETAALSQSNEASLRTATRELDATKAALATKSAEATTAKQEVATLTKAKEAAQMALSAKPVAPSYPDLRERVATLEHELTAARTAAPAYPDLRNNVTELEAKVAALTAASTRAQQETAALSQSNETLLRTATRELDATKAALAKANDALNAKPTAPAYPDLRSRVTELEAAYTATSTSLARASAEADRAKQETVALNKAKDEALAALAVKSAAPVAPPYPNLSGKVAELESALANSTQKAAAAEAARTEVVKQFDDYKSATAAAHREHTTLLASMKMLESDKTSLRRQAESAGTEAAQLRTQVASLKEQLAVKPTAAAAYPDLRSRVTILEADLVTAKELLAAKSTAPVYPDLSGKVAELETSLRDSTRQLAAAATEADRAKREVAQLNLSLADASKTASPTYPDYTALVKDLTAEVTKLRSDRAQLQQSLTTAERQTVELAATNSNRVKELEAQLNSLQTAAKPTAPTYPDLSGRVSELEAQVKAAPAVPAYPDLSGKVSELQAMLVDSAGKQAATQAAQIGLEQQLTAALETAKASGTTDAQLRRERDELNGRVSSLSGEVTQLRDDRERMQKLLADSGRKLRDSAADANRIKELETKGAALETALAARPAAPAYPDLSGRVSELEAALAAKPAALTYPDLSGRVAELEAQIAATPKSRAPAYPDLSDRVTELEGQLARARQTAATKPVTPRYPDLSGRVSVLESALADSRRELSATQTRLAQAASAPATVAEAAPVADTSDLEKKLAATEDRLATALRGYTLLEKDRDAQQARSGQASEALTGEKNVLAAQIATLTTQVEQLQSAAADQAASARASAANAQADTARLNESLATLQRSSGQTAGDAAAARTLVQQLQGANSVLAQENYQLKTALSRSTGGPAPVAPVTALVAPAAARMHVVVSGDSLSKLSQRYYGTTNRWQAIYNANAGKLGPNGILRIGTELRIP